MIRTPSTSMFRSVSSARLLTPALLAITLLAGCAGGVRNGATGDASGSAPAQAASTPAAAMATDGTEFMWKGEGGTVAVAGEFNAWNTSADPLVKQADGSWKLVKKLPAGRYAYKYVIDGGTWKEDPAAKETVDDGFGGKNAVVVVGGTPGTGTAAGTGVGAAVTPAAPAGKGRAPVAVADGVLFVFAGAASSVHLAGEFNAWSTSADPLVKQADGTWTITKKLASGTYAYKFVVDGSTWKTDEANLEGKDDGFGGKNSIVVVP